MSPQATLQSGAVKLVYDPRTRFPGERIEGVVELDLTRAKKDDMTSIKVKLRGIAFTEIIQSTSAISTSNTREFTTQKVFLKEDQSLWRAEAQKELQEGVVSLPFSFVLPEGIPSSFYLTNDDCTATISYGVEVVAKRLSVFKRDHRIGQVFSVVTPADEVQLTEAQMLGQGWNGKVTTSSASHEIKKMFSSHFPIAEAQMELPTLSSFPVGVPIPVAVIIRTRTKPMSKSDVSEESLSSSAKKPLSPAPPRDTTGVQFWLDTHHGLTAAPKSSSVSVAITVVEQRVHPLGGFGGSSSSNISVSEEKPVWIPNSEQHHETGKGRWQRGTRFESMITLACSPTTDFGIIKSAYMLHLEVPFSGMGNNLHLKVPIHVNSGVPPLRSGAPPPFVPDLPPAYFTGKHHEWDADEKSGS